jgi:hypothetical protein
MWSHKTYITITNLLHLNYIACDIIMLLCTNYNFNLISDLHATYIYYITKFSPEESTWLSFLAFCKLSLPLSYESIQTGILKN